MDKQKKKELRQLFRAASRWAGAENRRSDLDHYRAEYNAEANRMLRGSQRIVERLTHLNRLLEHSKNAHFHRIFQMVRDDCYTARDLISEYYGFLASTAERSTNLRTALGHSPSSNVNISHRMTQLTRAVDEGWEIRKDRYMGYILYSEFPQVTLNDGRNGFHNFGPFVGKILLSGGDTELMIFAAEDANTVRGGYYHPHITPEGRLCMGQLRHTVRQFTRDSIYPAGLWEMIYLFLRTYNADSPYFTLRHAESCHECGDPADREGGGGPCRDCGSGFCADCLTSCPACERRYCSHCNPVTSCDSCGHVGCNNCSGFEYIPSSGRVLCDECHRHCAICDRSHAEEDLYVCDDCGEYVCENCHTGCPVCDEIFCDSCYESHMEDTHPAEDEDEDEFDEDEAESESEAV